MPNAAYSGTALATAPCEFALRSSAPVRSAVTIAASSPSCADGATCTSMRPPVLAFTTSANLTAASWRGLPTAAPWPSVSLIGLRMRRQRQQGGSRGASTMRVKILRLHGGLSPWSPGFGGRESGSVNQHAAVHVERDAGAVRGQVAGEEDARARDVVGTAEPGERDRLGDLGLLLVASACPCVMSVSISPGVIELTRMLIGTELARHRARQAEHAGLGGRVVRAAEDAAAALRRDGRDADDRAAALLLHRRASRPATSTACRAG